MGTFGDAVRPAASGPGRRSSVAELVAGMTVAEKIGQITGVALGSSGPHGLGPGAPGVLVVPPAPLGETARRVADVQAGIVAASRLRVPALVLATGEPTDLPALPPALVRAATWNTELVGRLAATSAATLAGAGVHAGSGPSAAPALLRASWADVSASLGDDPVLAAEMLAAHVAGMQGPPTARFGPGRLAALLADLGGVAGQPGRGVDHAWSHRSLRAAVLPPAEAAVRAGAALVTPAPVGNDGIPTHADSWLLRDVLREWGFDGVVVAGLAEITALAERHRVAESPDAALAMAVESGVHVVLAPPTDGAHEDAHRRLTRLLVDGRVSPFLVDAAVTQLLLVKAALGLLDPERSRPATGGDAERYPLAEQAAAESLVLLTDPRTSLPLAARGAIGVVSAGPAAETVGVRALVAALASRHPGGARALDPVPGADLPADVDAVAVLVEDAAERTWAAETLVGRLVASGRPCVAVVCGGDPRDVGALVATTAAVLLCWQPVTAHAATLAAVLLGEAEAGGRLPLTITGPGGEVLFPLGHGSGYTRFEYSHLRIGPDRTSNGAQVVVSCRVTNTGTRPGKEVVQVHVHDDVASIAPSGRTLAAFAVVTVEPGRTTTVTLRIPAERVALWDRAMRHVVEPGTFTVLVGRSATDVRLRGSFVVDSTRDLTQPPA